MAHVQQRRALSGPALIRLLARLADTDVSPPGQSLSDRLSQWLSWTDAITLSSALSASPATATPGVLPVGADAATLCSRVRTALTKAIGATGLPEPRSNSSARAPAPASDVDFADFRQRYVSMQQTMETEVGSLRGRLRRALAAKTPDLARLAVLDASLEQALAVRERTLLGAIPSLLGQHFERLRAADEQRQADHPADSAAPAPSGAWLNTFRSDMRSVLLAELEVRFQPVEGLLAALGPR